MEKQKTGSPRPKVLGFKADGNMVAAVEGLAKSRGLNTSEFIRVVMGKILEPAKDRAEESEAVIKSLSPSSQKKVARVSAIQKILIGLRADQAKAGALDDVFQDGDGEVVAGKIQALELELAGLKKEVRKELAGFKKSGEKEGGPKVCRADDEAEEGPKGELPCPACGALVGFKKGKGGGLLCPACGAAVVVEEAGDEADDDEAEEVAAEEVEGEEDDEAEENDEAEEVEGEEGPAEIKATRFIEINRLIEELRGCRELRSILDNLLNGGPPVCDLMIKALKAEVGGDLSDDEVFGRLREAAVRAVAIRKKILELQKSEGSESLVAELEADMNELRKALPGQKAPKKKRGLFDSIFD